jgi:hypothetical protein
MKIVYIIVCSYVWVQYIRIRQNQSTGYSFTRVFIQLNPPGFCSKFLLDRCTSTCILTQQDKGRVTHYRLGSWLVIPSYASEEKHHFLYIFGFLLRLFVQWRIEKRRKNITSNINDCRSVSHPFHAHNRFLVRPVCKTENKNIHHFQWT